MSDAVRRCADCGVEIAPGLLACPRCRKLVHAERLKTLAAEAEEAEREGRITDALSSWRAVLELLPAKARQRDTVTATIRRLSEAVDTSSGQPPAGAGGKLGRAAAGVGAAGLVAWKLKLVLLSLLGKAKLLITGLTSLPTLLSMFAWFALDRSSGVTFVAGLVISIYVHEIGHVWALRLYGIKATAPMFVPGLGALVRLRQYPIDAREDARVGLAGPVWGSAAAFAALALGVALRDRTLLSVASVGAAINVFNLVPFWQLDGARGFRALDARQRGIVLAVAAGAALLSSQPMGWVVCAVGAFRRKRDLPERGDARALWTFSALLAALSLAGWLASALAPPAPGGEVEPPLPVSEPIAPPSGP